MLSVYYSGNTGNRLILVAAVQDFEMLICQKVNFTSKLVYNDILEKVRKGGGGGGWAGR